MKRTVVQRFDTLGGEESFLKGWLVKGFLDSFSFFFFRFLLFFSERRETIKKCVYSMHARPGKENFGKIRKGILLSLLESRVIRICLKRELANFLWNLLESSRRNTEVE